MNIALIDNDLIYRKNHNFPNLAIMKLSGFHKSKGDNVELVSFDRINPSTLFVENYDRIYISKAFTDTYTPTFVDLLGNVVKGGTGFYFDKATPLDYNTEHSKPDYDIYKSAYGIIKNKMFYDDYSIGYTTRGCFRHCPFCVNKNSNKVSLHSPIDEFYDTGRKKLVMLDDNILGLPDVELFKIFDKLEEINKPFQYRQGMDIRLLTKDRVNRLLRLKYDGGNGGLVYYFAFDLWKFRSQIELKLKLFSESYLAIKPNAKWIRTKLYVFCGFNEHNVKNIDFWIDDLELIFKRFEIIFKYKAAPFLMKHEDYKKSPFVKIYNEIANYANGMSGTVITMSFNQYIETSNKNTSAIRKFRDDYPVFRKYFDLRIN